MDHDSSRQEGGDVNAACKDDLDGKCENTLVEATEPHVGMTFKSFEDAMQFYNQYSNILGFGIKTRRSWYDDEKKLIRFQLTCCKAGKPRQNASNDYRAKPTARTDCGAQMQGKLDQDGMYYIVKVNLKHNHETSPSKARFFRSNKLLPEKAKKQLEYNDRVGIPLHKTFDSLVAEAGAYENVQYGERECRNYIEKVRRSILGEGDAEAIHQYFMRMQGESPNFFYLMCLDGEGRLRNVFWADGRSRMAYRYFGDVITFDSTYLTNKYDMPFAPFVGVNHHGQSVLMGCGLLSEESTDAYIWLFKAWLACMSGQPPNAIITDQCKAIQGAIKEVFPNAEYRFCLWHIMRKVPEKLGRYADYKAIKKLLKKAVYDSLRLDDFEETWSKMINGYALENNEWLATLYRDRHSWIPVFMKDIFWAGMSTTQRSESMNAFFDGYVHAKTSLKQFVTKYDMALNSKYEKEALADFESFHKTPVLISELCIEEQLSKVYTLGMFKKFQIEIKALVNCTATEVNNDGYTVIYEVKERTKKKDGITMECKNYDVLFKKSELVVHCICRAFQFKGILCRHSICVLNHQNVNLIPSQYILDRWRKDFKRTHSIARSCHAIPEGPKERYDALYKMCHEFAESGYLCNEKYELALKILKEGVEQLNRHEQNAMQLHSVSSTIGSHVIKENQIASSIEDGTLVGCLPKVWDPLQVRRKGRPKEKRRESMTDKIIKAKKKKVSKNAKDIDVQPQKESDIRTRQHSDSLLLHTTQIEPKDHIQLVTSSVNGQLEAQIAHPQIDLRRIP